MKILRGKETILLVEDEDLVREMTGLMLRENGYQVLEARNGSEALHIWREHQEAIHLVLTDQSLPGISGLDLVSRLAGLRPGIKVILMSGFAVEELGQEIVDSMVGFIQKPFRTKVLITKISESLNIRGLS